MTVARRREDVESLRVCSEVSERKALLAMTGRAAAIVTGTSCPRFGYRRLYVLLRGEGWVVNHRLVYRLYGEEGLAVRIKRRKKLASEARACPPEPATPNERWTMDLPADRLADGRRIRVLTVLDICASECVALHAGQSFGSVDVTRVLDCVRDRTAWRSVDDPDRQRTGAYVAPFRPVDVDAPHPDRLHPVLPHGAKRVHRAERVNKNETPRMGIY